MRWDNHPEIHYGASACPYPKYFPGKSREMLTFRFTAAI
jgi:hypothetical protein